MIKTKYSIFGIGFVALLVVVVAMAQYAGANPSQFFPTKATAVASTTLAYLSPGMGTTTLSYDSYQGDAVKIDKLNLALQFTATTTATASTTLKFRFEDSPDNIDWYPRATALTINATTTSITENFGEYQWRISTTTDNGGSGINTRVHQSIIVDAPMRYVRVIFYIPSLATGGTTGGLWAQMIPFKELNGK